MVWSRTFTFIALRLKVEASETVNKLVRKFGRLVIRHMVIITSGRGNGGFAIGESQTRVVDSCRTSGPPSFLGKGHYAERVGAPAYSAAEVLELAGNASNNK